MRRLFKKTMRDLLRDKRRAAYSLLAILLGTMAFGIITFVYEISGREIVDLYTAINPASATITVDRIDGKLIDITNSFDGIAEFERKSYNMLRVQMGQERWKTFELFASQDFSANNINKIESVEGSFRSGPGEMLIERASLGVAGAGIGDTLTAELPDGSLRELEIVGVVADIGLHPATIHDTVYAYVSYDELLDMGLSGNRIDFKISGNPYDRDRILSIGNEYMRLLEQNGYAASDLQVSDTPGISMHLGEYRSVLFLLQGFSAVSFLFGCMIMSSLISSIIGGQTRQIAILKSIGVGTGKIMAAYLLALFALIAVSTAVSIILCTLLSGVVSTALLGISNMRPANLSVSAYLYWIYCAMALAVPMIIAWFPIRRGVGVSVRDALNDYGVSANEKPMNLPELKCLSRPVLLSLRNAVRRKRRFVLNVAILSIAGAIFVSVVTTMISLQATLTDNVGRWKLDYQFTTGTAYAEGELDELMAKIPRVTSYEIWGMGQGVLVNADGESVRTYPLLSPPNCSVMLEPDIMEGRWLTAEDEGQIVVSHGFFLSEPGYRVGDAVSMQIGGEVRALTIVGTMKNFGETSVFISKNGFRRFVPEADRMSNIKMSLDMSGSRRRTGYGEIDAAIRELGIRAMQTQSKTDLVGIASNHLTATMQTFWLIISTLVVISGFGLTAAMNMQTSERTREIGIMKAMGAAKKQIAGIVTSESILIALASWCVAVMLGIPLGVFSVYAFGDIILETPLTFNVLPLLAAYGIWLALTLFVGYQASRSCAKRAAEMSIRETLAFE